MMDQSEWPNFEKIGTYLPQVIAALCCLRLPHLRAVQNMHFFETKDGPHEQGRMIISIELTGKTDADALFKNVTAAQWLEFQKHHLEYKMHHLEQITNETGILAKTFRVMDLKGLGMSHFHRDLMDMIKTGNKEIEENYPEVMGKCFIVNAPWVFQGIWAVVKPWLPPRTLAKIEFYGKGNEFKDAMRKFVEEPSHPSLSFIRASPYEGGGSLPLSPSLAPLEGQSDPGKDGRDRPGVLRGRQTVGLEGGQIGADQETRAGEDEAGGRGEGTGGPRTYPAPI